MLKFSKFAERCEDQEANLKKVIKLADVGAPHVWGHFKDGVLKSCDEVCRKKRGEVKEILGVGMKR